MEVGDMKIREHITVWHLAVTKNMMQLKGCSICFDYLPLILFLPLKTDAYHPKCTFGWGYQNSQIVFCSLIDKVENCKHAE